MPWDDFSFFVDAALIGRTPPDLPFAAAAIGGLMKSNNLDPERPPVPEPIDKDLVSDMHSLQA